MPIAAQIDHASDLAVIADAVAAGADSVLVDGSSLEYEENNALVRAVLAVLDGSGSAAIVIEAELGGLAGDEDRAFSPGRARTGATAKTSRDCWPNGAPRPGISRRRRWPHFRAAWCAGRQK